MDSVLTIGLSPAFERILVIPDFEVNTVNRSVRQYLYASGKGVNVTRALGRMGRDAVNITHLGKAGEKDFLALAENEGIKVRYVESNSFIRTCTTVIDENNETSTELVEEAWRVEDGISKSIYSLFLEEVEDHKAVTISGTKAPGYSPSLIPDIVKECSKRNKITVLDIKGEDLISSLKYNPTVIKPNLEEFALTFNLSGDDIESESEKIMKKIYSDYGTVTVISRGGDPLWYFDGNAFGEIEIPHVRVRNTIGCGDTLTAVMTHFILEGIPLSEALVEAVRAAGSKAGNTTFDFEL